jgi:hypothetical protein
MVPGKPTDVRNLLEYAVSQYGYIQNRLERNDSSHIPRDVVIAMLKVDTKRAIDIGISMEMDERRDAALLSIIRAISALDPDRAQVLAYHVAGPGARAGALSTVAAAMAEGDTDTAMTLLQDARRTGRAAGGKAPAAVARAIAVLDPDLAVRVLAEDSEISYLGDGLAGIAKIVMRNDPVRAGEIALDIPDPSRRAYLLTQIAAASRVPLNQEKSETVSNLGVSPSATLVQRSCP